MTKTEWAILNRGGSIVDVLAYLENPENAWLMYTTDEDIRFLEELHIREAK